MELTWVVAACCFFLIPLVLLATTKLQHRRRRRAPPGPASVPIIGNLAWLTLRDSMDELRILRRLHSRFGPLVSTRFGCLEQVNVADRRLAHAALVDRGAGALLADRSALMVSLDMFGPFCSSTIHACNHGPRWSILRRNLAAEVLSPARLRQSAPSRELALAELIRKLQLQAEETTEVRPRDAFQHALFSLVIAMCFGEVLDESSVDKIAVATRDFTTSAITSSLRDILMFCPAVTTRLFPGLLRSKEARRQKLKSLCILPLIHARRRRKKKLQEEHDEEEISRDSSSSLSLPHCYVDSLLDLRLDDDGGRPLTDDEIASLCIEILIVAPELPATALEWIMAELVKNPGVQEKLHEEISSAVIIDKGIFLSEEHYYKQQMPYLRAVVLEGLRRHPPGHQMAPRTAREDVELGGYVVPKGSSLNFMLYDFGMDDTTWDRPTLFMPERFLPGGEAEAVDITGTKEVKMIPFGAGRRICPGRGISLLILESFVANLVASFQWKEVQPGDVDAVSEEAQLTVVMAKPLRARLVSRRSSS